MVFKMTVLIYYSKSKPTILLKPDRSF